MFCFEGRLDAAPQGDCFQRRRSEGELIGPREGAWSGSAFLPRSGPASFLLSRLPPTQLMATGATGAAPAGGDGERSSTRGRLLGILDDLELLAR